MIKLGPPAPSPASQLAPHAVVCGLAQRSMPARAPAVRSSLACLALVIAAALWSVAAPALAVEQINLFDETVEVERSGDIVVTERIDVTVEGNQIRHGIFRDMPRYFEDRGQRYAFDYHLLSVTRDGREEPYETETDGNAFRVQIGDADTLVDHGVHRYELRYRVPNQVRYFDTYDELYWNVTGNEWPFAIKHARATIVLPTGARVTRTAAYTGRLGQAGSEYAHRVDGERHVFETTRGLAPNEGLSVAVGFEKGAVDPPSAADEAGMWWQRYGAIGILAASLGGLFFFLYRAWTRVGRDPPKGPVFPRYEAPDGLSPAGVHYIYHRGVQGHRALIATLMNLAVKGRITIDASDKKYTHLTHTEKVAHAPNDASEDMALEARLFANDRRRTLGQTYDSAFTATYGDFRQALARNYGSLYFRWNAIYTIGALAVSLVLVVLAATQAVTWTIWHTIGVLALAVLNIAFMYLMPAPTAKGQETRTAIEGFKLYMEKAEQLQLNAVQPGSEAPPPMTTERYERFLPYAVALGVEEPWTKHFERLIPEEAARYSPVWAGGYYGGSRSMSGVTSAVVASMTSGVVSAMPQSSSSSGSGGGGFSGGGGGGGGGGGW